MRDEGHGTDTMFQATTAGITVTVTPAYLEDQSDPNAGRWSFAYRIEIANGSEETVQLRSRYWHIMDGLGRVQEVRGAGVVGEEPMLGPGDSFTYGSGCPLPTATGFMRGHYNFERSDGTFFQVAIPPFPLDMPGADRVLN